MNIEKQPVDTAAAWLRTIRMVAWGFFGVRKQSEFEDDVRTHPLQIVFVALVAIVVLVIALVALVHWVAG
jgi:amino acid transporter